MCHNSLGNQIRKKGGLENYLLSRAHTKATLSLDDYEDTQLVPMLDYIENQGLITKVLLSITFTSVKRAVHYTFSINRASSIAHVQ